jgi:hypothetical protein
MKSFLAFSTILLTGLAARAGSFDVPPVGVKDRVQVDRDPAKPTEAIDQFVILVHPCPYEATGTAETNPYRVLERAACKRWLDAIPSLPKSTFAVQIDGAKAGPSPERLQTAFVSRLGAGHVLRIPVEFVSPEDPSPLRDYYRRIKHQILQQLSAQRLMFDPATCKTIIWGQSFEGCASGYGSAVASYLGLKTLTQFDYHMSAPDAPFLLKAKFLQTVAVPASDVEAYLFDLADGRYAAFFRSRLTPQWLDYRPIRLRLDSSVSVLTKNKGAVVWPQVAAPTEEQIRSSRFNEWRAVVWPQDTPATGSHSFTLSTVQERYIVGTSREKLISVVKSAAVKLQVSSSSR